MSENSNMSIDLGAGSYLQQVKTVKGLLSHMRAKQEGYRVEDLIEEPSYSILNIRASRYLGEVISSLTLLGEPYIIECDDCGNVKVTIPSYDGDTFFSMPETSMHCPSFVEALANSLALLLEFRLMGHRTYITHIVQVYINHGQFLNAKTGKLLASDVHKMAEFLSRETNIAIEIVCEHGVYLE